MRYHNALVQSKSDVEKLIRYAEEQLDVLVALHDQYGAMLQEDDEGVTRITNESGIVYDEFQYTSERLGKYLEDELAALSKLLWQQITRPEEQRKFVRMRNALEKVVVPFLGDPEDYYQEDKIDANSDPKEYVGPTLKTLRYLKNYWHRIERYQEVECQFKRGPFTVLNEYGYQPGEYDQELVYLGGAASRVSAMGFDSLLYGDVVLTTVKGLGGNFIGMYYSVEDKVYLAVDYVPREEGKRDAPIPVLIHEFGHRLWKKFVPQDAKDHYVVSYGWLSGYDIAALWQHLEDSGFSLARAKQGQSDRTIEELHERWKKAVRVAKKAYQISMKDMRLILSGEGRPPLQEGEARMVVKRDGLVRRLKGAFYGREGYLKNPQPFDYYKPRGSGDADAITWYGRKNPEENFCESFMYFCMGWDMPPKFEARLLAALEQVPNA